MLEFLRKSITLELTSSHKQLFESNFVNEIKSGLRNFKSENARHDFINLLLNFIRIYENVFPKYKDLLLLCDKEDVERDFFENITHIQVCFLKFSFLSFFILLAFIDAQKISCVKKVTTRLQRTHNFF